VLLDSIKPRDILALTTEKERSQLSQMSNVVALHAFSNNEPLQTIVEAANSDCEPTEPGESRLLQYEDIYHTQVARLGGAEEWQSTTSDGSFRVEEDGSSPTMGPRLRSGRVGPRTR
jgi:hypothetical protein